jgi:hypothetical protein
LQILALFFNIALSLPKKKASVNDIDLESSYSALSSLEDIVSIIRREASIDQAEVFHRVVSSLCVLLSKDEVTSLSRFDIEIEEGDKITITIFCVHI